MNKRNFTTSFTNLMADVYTPVGIYLRLRDRFRDSVLLESTDFHVSENSFSIICVNAIGGIEIATPEKAEMKYPAEKETVLRLTGKEDIAAITWDFMQQFQADTVVNKPMRIAQSFFGYMSYDAIPFFENIQFNTDKKAKTIELTIPLIRYRFYQYVIIINHHKDEMYVCENHFRGVESRLDDVLNLIKSKDIPVYPFAVNGEQQANISGDAFMQNVNTGIAACQGGDVFQVVLSRRFYQPFTGDDFNVYRALRTINPSPYLFYFDYGDYKLMGSSPESQLIIDDSTATIHPIAGTFKRTGDDDTDKQLAIALENDEKENAEHVMLVDLARNDLSLVCTDVMVSSFKKVQYYSHVIHLVSEVQGKVSVNNPFKVLCKTFPAGTLSGAPKFKAMQIIDENEIVPRGFYGGAIGFIGLNGDCNHAIMIRTFLSKNNTLISQAGAGVVVNSKPESELQELNNKLAALQLAVTKAQNMQV